MQYITTISQKGQVVVPKDIRDKLNLKPSNVLNVKEEKGKIVITPAPSSDEIFGLFKTKKPITQKDI
jgi:AbrB family looped-hinge helix DNA binding protein